jgi:hypothetical protein
MEPLAVQTVQFSEAGVPDDASAVVPVADSSANQMLDTVGLALLSYGLVQLLAKLIDKLPLGRVLERRTDTGGGFTEEDRKRLERTYELVTSDTERVDRMHQIIREIQEQTRWLAEQRSRTDPRDGEPMWNCRGRLLVERLDTQQRLVGQALDDLRELDKKHENALRKLRALWRRAGRRQSDGR